MFVATIFVLAFVLVLTVLNVMFMCATIRLVRKHRRHVAQILLQMKAPTSQVHMSQVKRSDFTEDEIKQFESLVQDAYPGCTVTFSGDNPELESDPEYAAHVAKIEEKYSKSLITGTCVDCGKKMPNAFSVFAPQYDDDASASHATAPTTLREPEHEWEAPSLENTKVELEVSDPACSYDNGASHSEPASYDSSASSSSSSDSYDTSLYDSSGANDTSCGE